MTKTIKQLEQDYLDAARVTDYDAAYMAYILWQEALEKENT